MSLITKLLDRLRRHRAPEIPPSALSEEEFYKRLFVNDPEWSRPEPNVDEQSRWEQIERLVEKYGRRDPGARILDAGCGRGWLTNLLSRYGEAMGVEPIAPVVAHARQLFPQLRFEVGIPADLRMDAAFDVIVSSEVLEHVIDKPAFVRDLRRLSKPGALLVVTTPRGELYREWTKKNGMPSQPIEQWIPTRDLLAMLRANGFEILESATAFDMGIYQIHACRSVA